MSILGIDYGSSKIGLAKSDDTKSLALPIEVLKNTSKDEVLNHINQIIKDNNIDQIVVGIPVSVSNKDQESDQLKEVLLFIDWLKENIDLPIIAEDERMSTMMASSMTQGMGGRAEDDVAAMVILQNYLDKQNK